jgi:hypothetical protein
LKPSRRRVYGFSSDGSGTAFVSTICDERLSAGSEKKTCTGMERPKKFRIQMW